MDDTTTPAAVTAAVDPASVNPADQILDNLDAFVGVVVEILTGGAIALSSSQARGLMQTGAALKSSTAKIRELMDGDDEDDRSVFGIADGRDGRASLSDELEARFIAQGDELTKYLAEFDKRLTTRVENALNASSDARRAQIQSVDERFSALNQTVDTRFSALEKSLASFSAASATKGKGGKSAEPAAADAEPPLLTTEPAPATANVAVEG